MKRCNEMLQTALQDMGLMATGLHFSAARTCERASKL